MRFLQISMCRSGFLERLLRLRMLYGSQRAKIIISNKNILTTTNQRRGLARLFLEVV